MTGVVRPVAKIPGGLLIHATLFDRPEFVGADPQLSNHCLRCPEPGLCCPSPGLRPPDLLPDCTKSGGPFLRKCHMGASMVPMLVKRWVWFNVLRACGLQASRCPTQPPPHPQILDTVRQLWRRARPPACSARKRMATPTPIMRILDVPLAEEHLRQPLPIGRARFGPSGENADAKP